jgi:hypothetical protein
MAAVELIPPEGEREWVLDALRGLVEACGHEHLVSTPVVLPSERCFPDRWSPDAGGVRRLALRILRYAGLPELDVEVEMFDDGRGADLRLEPGAIVRTQGHEGAAAWFAGIVDDTCLFGAHVSLLGDPGGVTAALAHETAHAFRYARELVVEDRDLEECLTDLSTIYLGFGILTTNATLRHRSWSIGGGGTSLGGHAWSTQHLGYLSPQAMCFALAVFERVRERGWGCPSLRAGRRRCGSRSCSRCRSALTRAGTRPMPVRAPSPSRQPCGASVTGTWAARSGGSRSRRRRCSGS